jgi:hypothetical protein
MNAPVAGVEWLMSAYDATCHAFPAVQVSDRTRDFCQALCDHSVPVRHVERAARLLSRVLGALQRAHPRRPALAAGVANRWPPLNPEQPQEGKPMITAPTRSDRLRQRDNQDQRQYGHPLDAAGPDPSGLTPLCDEPEFTAILESMVADEAPRLFAVVQEYGKRVDGMIVAWGMAFADHAEVVSVTRGMRMSLKARRTHCACSRSAATSTLAWCGSTPTRPHPPRKTQPPERARRSSSTPKLGGPAPLTRNSLPRSLRSAPSSRCTARRCEARQRPGRTLDDQTVALCGMSRGRKPRLPGHGPAAGTPSVTPGPPAPIHPTIGHSQ